jgi:hypothetical protein
LALLRALKIIFDRTPDDTIDLFEVFPGLREVRSPFPLTIHHIAIGVCPVEMIIVSSTSIPPVVTGLAGFGKSRTLNRVNMYGERKLTQSESDKRVSF